MNVQNLRTNYPKLIDYMRKEDYSNAYMDSIVREVERIIKLATIREWNSYEDIYYDYMIEKETSGYLKQKRSLLNTIKHFDLYNKYPDRELNTKFIADTAYSQLSNDYKAIIDYFLMIEQKRGRKKSTVSNDASCGANFLLYLQENGYNDLDKITEKAVISFFTSADGTIHKSYEYRKSVASVFKAYGSISIQGKIIVGFLPKLKHHRKNIQYLTVEEMNKFKNALRDKDNKLSFRTRAISYIIAYTGIRSCDVANLKLDSIDWENDTINIKQQKTGTPLQLPLTAIIGNAIYNYITLERENVTIDRLFITYRKPYKALKSIDIRKAINKTMEVARIRQKQGERKGSHLFRHRVATELISRGVSQPVVSTILGHDSPDSLNSYLYTDFVHLKQCALSIEGFPIPKEVNDDASI